MPEKNEHGLIFGHVLYPMWISDRETLAFLDANAAATEVYGFSRDEFLKMTLLGIRIEPSCRKLHNGRNDKAEEKAAQNPSARSSC